MSLEQILGMVQGLAPFITAIMSNPWTAGISLLGLGGGVIGLWQFLIRKNNARIDADEIARAGADAGLTAVDLRQQSESNNQYSNTEFDEFKKKGPTNDEPPA